MTHNKTRTYLHRQVHELSTLINQQTKACDSGDHGHPTLHEFRYAVSIYHTTEELHQAQLNCQWRRQIIFQKEKLMTKYNVYF